MDKDEQDKEEEVRELERIKQEENKRKKEEEEKAKKEEEENRKKEEIFKKKVEGYMQKIPDFGYLFSNEITEKSHDKQ